MALARSSTDKEGGVCPQNLQAWRPTSHPGAGWSSSLPELTDNQGWLTISHLYVTSVF